MNVARNAHGVHEVDVVSTLILAPDPRAVRNARAFVEDRCRAGGVEVEACETAVLLTSETVTNAFVHGRSDAHITVTVGSDRVVVEVGDDNTLLPHAVRQRAESVHGRGLVILDNLASRWGIVEHVEGKTVWFEVLFVPPPPPSAMA